MEQDQAPDHLQLLRGLRKTRRDEIILAAWRAGISQGRIHRETGMSPTTIIRIIRNALALERVGDG